MQFKTNRTCLLVSSVGVNKVYVVIIPVFSHRLLFLHVCLLVDGN